MKKLLLVALVGCMILFAHASISSASCTVYGTVQYVLYQSGYTYIYVTPAGNAFPNSGYQFWTTEDQVAQIAAAGLASGKRIYVIGDSASCGGAAGWNWTGHVTYIYVATP